MTLYLDTEFNGHGGVLMTLALAASDGSSWYGVWPAWCYGPLQPWVEENVYPKINSMPRDFSGSGEDNFRKSLHGFLLRHPGADIYADWPADFEHFARLLAGPTFDQALDYECSMHLVKTPPGQPRPEIPHNALSDAIALCVWHQGSAR